MNSTTQQTVPRVFMPSGRPAYSDLTWGWGAHLATLPRPCLEPGEMVRGRGPEAM